MPVYIAKQLELTPVTSPYPDFSRGDKRDLLARKVFVMDVMFAGVDLFERK